MITMVTGKINIQAACFSNETNAMLNSHHPINGLTGCLYLKPVRPRSSGPAPETNLNTPEMNLGSEIRCLERREWYYTVAMAGSQSDSVHLDGIFFCTLDPFTTQLFLAFPSASPLQLVNF